LYDPHGINREELLRLCELKKPVSFFNEKFLSTAGFKVKATDKNVWISGGAGREREFVADGATYSEDFLLKSNITADFLVPLGGKFGTINASNVDKLLSHKGGKTTPRFKHLIEGANMVITEDARLTLERNGVLFFPNSAASKGVVTAGSREALCAMALSPADHQAFMCSKDGLPTLFYQRMCEEIEQEINKYAVAEFNLLWAEMEKTKQPLSSITTSLHNKLSKLHEAIYDSNLYEDDPQLVNIILKLALPNVLLEKVSISEIQDRVPAKYLRSMFAQYIASNFVYSNGIHTDDIALWTFLDSLRRP
jgi:glutamate dehydrogenase